MVVEPWVFFFSSRRRHTRSLCDWSSDVCSSDLPPNRSGRSLRRRSGSATFSAAVRLGRRLNRSEERRVGKECRPRWSPHHEKKQVLKWLCFQNVEDIILLTQGQYEKT